jgi:ABC-type multidrug transport system ATPase subunit
MKITLTDAGKRFNRDWIFRHFSYTFQAGQSYAITGPNGSGKSTLLQVIAGAIHPSEGDLLYETTDGHEDRRGNDQVSVQNHAMPAENIHRHISISAPYLEVVEEMTLQEFLLFHHVFKPFLQPLSIEKIMGLVGLDDAAHKQIRYFSSGMKQRVKLAQAIFSDTAILLLDEPCTNLDEEGIAMYGQLLQQYATGRLVIVSSNDPQEYKCCRTLINIRSYK